MIHVLTRCHFAYIQSYKHNNNANTNHIRGLVAIRKMKITLAIFTTLFLSSIVFGQDSKVSSRQLKQQEIDSIFTDSLKTKLQIEYSIYRIYQYRDKSGEHFIVMTENEFECDEKEKCFV